MKYLRTFEYHNNKKTSDGIEWLDEYTPVERRKVEEILHNQIADKISDGHTNGTAFHDDPEFAAHWSVEIEEDENPVEVREEEVANMIRDGYNNGVSPTFSWEARVKRVGYTRSRGYYKYD